MKMSPAARLDRALRGLRKRVGRLIPANVAVWRRYRRINAGRSPNLRHPRDLSEKLCWLKLHGLTELQICCTDKIEVRDYVTGKLGEDVLVPLILATEDLGDVTPEAIPDETFVLKTSHDSGGVVICWNRESFDWSRARDFLRWRMGVNYYWNAREPAYRHIRPRILAEALLPSTPDAPLEDYKFWCFGGRVRMIQVISAQVAFDAEGFEGERGIGDGVTDAFMDRDWARLDWRLKKPPMPVDPPAPKSLTRMIAMAETLSAPFPFVRVDLYESARQPYFGEMTFFPNGGTARFDDDAVERALGDLVDLSEVGTT